MNNDYYISEITTNNGNILEEYNGNDKEIIFDSTYIEHSACENNNYIESLFLPNAERIRYDAFNSCRFLNQVHFSNKIRTIESGSFSNCFALTSIAIPVSRELVIEAGAFYNTPLTKVDFGNRKNFDKIHDNTLLITAKRCPICKNICEETRNGFTCSHCNRTHTWKDLEAFKGLYVTGTAVAGGCYDDKRVSYIPEGIKSIQSFAFDDSCATWVELPESLSSIGVRSFHWSDRLHHISIPSKVTRFEQYSFCNTMLSYVYADNLKYIGQGTFNGCPLLEEVTSDKIKVIAEQAFANCNLKEMAFGPYTSIVGPYAFFNNSLLKKVRFSPSVITIQKGAFELCCSLSEITFTNGLLNIEKEAFKDCERLEKLELPDTLLSSSEGSFKGCKNLKTVILPESLRFIKAEDIFEETTKIIYRPEKTESKH